MPLPSIHSAQTAPPLPAGSPHFVASLSASLSPVILNWSYIARRPRTRKVRRGVTGYTRSSSVDFPVEPVIRPTQLPPISRRDETGFSSCVTHPHHHAVASTPPECSIASIRFR